VASRLVRSVRPLPLTAAGLAIAAVGLAAVGRITIDSSYAGTTLHGLLLLPAGVTLTFSAATVVAVHGADRAQAGLAGALLNTAVELGPALGLAGLVALASTRANHLLAHGQLPATAATSGYRWAFTAAKETIADGIWINAISPGPVDTPMSRFPGETDVDRDARLATVVPIGRVATTAEIAAAILWLASPESSFTVGHDLLVEGAGTP